MKNANSNELTDRDVFNRLFNNLAKRTDSFEKCKINQESTAASFLKNSHFFVNAK